MGDLKVIGIIEDEVLIASYLSSNLQKMGYTTPEPAHTFNEGLELIKNEDIDLFIIDINLEGHKDGIELARHIRNQSSRPIIFLTAYSDEETLYEAKDTCPDAFLIKPASRDQLRSSIAIALNNYETMLTTQERPESILVKDGYEHKKIKINDINFILSDHNYVTYHLKGQIKVMERNTIKELVDKLSPLGFIKINRSTIVNIENIDTVDSHQIIVGGSSFKLNKKNRDLIISKMETML